MKQLGMTQLVYIYKDNILYTLHQLNDLLEPQLVHPYMAIYIFLLPKHFHFKIRSIKCLKVIVAKVSTLKVIKIKSAKGCTDILANY